MICSNCGQEFEGNFCANCGTRAPELQVCSACQTSFTGNFCPNCGAPTAAQVENFYNSIIDRFGNPIDLEQVAGLYLSERETWNFLRKATEYSDNDIGALSAYIFNEIDGYDYGYVKLITEKAKLEAKYAPKKTYAQYNEPLASAQPERPPTKRERILENKRNAVACCPKCGSTSLSANKKGFGIGKAVVGAALTGGIGLIAGNIGAKKVWVTCLNCGQKWKM